MKITKNIQKCTVAIFSLMFCGLNSYADVQIVQKDDLELNLGLRMQVFGYGEVLDDPYRDDYRMGLFLKQLRPSISGGYKAVKFKVQYALGGEDSMKILYPNDDYRKASVSSTSLLDAYADFLMGSGSVFIRAGQFKVPYSREKLGDSGSTYFVDRSLNNLGFSVGRDVGVAISGNFDKISAAVGAFAGAGINVPIRHLDEEIGIPLLVARVGLNSDADKNALTADLDDLEPTKPKWAVFLNGMYMKDSGAGSYSALYVRGQSRLQLNQDRSLLMSPWWNSDLTGKDQSVYTQIGADATYRAPLGNGRFLTTEIEGNYASFSPEGNKANRKLSGGRAMLAVYTAPVQLALHYSVLFPKDGKFDYTWVANGASNNRTVFGDDTGAIHEVTPSITYYLCNNVKLQIDLPIGIDNPIIIREATSGRGAINLMKMPDQTRYLSTHAAVKVERQVTVEGRAMVQVSF